LGLRAFVTRAVINARVTNARKLFVNQTTLK